MICGGGKRLGGGGEGGTAALLRISRGGGEGSSSLTFPPSPKPIQDGTLQKWWIYVKYKVKLREALVKKKVKRGTFVV